MPFFSFGIHSHNLSPVLDEQITSWSRHWLSHQVVLYVYEQNNTLIPLLPVTGSHVKDMKWNSWRYPDIISWYEIESLCNKDSRKALNWCISVYNDENMSVSPILPQDGKIIIKTIFRLYVFFFKYVTCARSLNLRRRLNHWNKYFCRLVQLLPVYFCEHYNMSLSNSILFSRGNPQTITINYCQFLHF